MTEPMHAPLPVLAEVHSALDEPLARRTDRSQQLAIAAGVAYRAGVADGRRQAVEEKAVATLLFIERRLVGLPWMQLGGVPYVGREHLFEVVNDAAAEVAIVDAYATAALAAGRSRVGDCLSPLDLARRNRDVPGRESNHGA